jgi:glycosyltransferase involved in cell wall biosynthesis
MKPFLSVVTISFNQRQFLQQTLDSVLSQKTADVEYIVVDPGSTDGSRELLQACAGQIDHLILEPDLGPADGLNKGFARARGRIGYFINSDDFLLPGAITRLRDAWQRYPDAGALFAGAWIVDGDGAPLRCLDALPVSLRALLLNRTPVIQQGFSFTMDAFHKAGGFNAENRTCWDYELICGMAAKGLRLHSLPGRIGAFRLHGQGLSGGVGGAAHDACYRADIDRIKLRYSSRPRDALARLVERSGTLFKHALHPAWTLERLADAAIAGRMHAKWRRDSQ